MAFVGTRRALLGGSSLPRWAAGFDLWYNYQVPQGSYALAFPPATDTHSSTINALTPAGTYQSFAANVPVRTGLGLQTVPTRTNLAVYSTDTTNANWTVSAASKTTGQTDFLGGTGAALVTADGTSASHSMSAAQTTGLTYTNGTTYSLSRIVKPGTQTLLQLSGPFAAFGGSQYANFSLTGAGSITASAGLTSSGVQALAGGWYRIWVTLPATATVGAAGGVIGFISSGSDTRLPTNSLATNYTDFGAQVEAAAFPSPLIVTAGASATVNGNQQVIDLTGKLATGASGFMQVSIQNPSGGAFDPYVFDISDGTANNRLNVRNNSTNFRVSAAAGGVSQAAFNAAAWQTGIVTLAFAISTNYVNVRIVGQADPGAVTSATYPTGMTIFTVGGLGTGTGSNIFQYTRKLALKFGPQNASTFAAAFAAAQLAAVSP